jgi:hypothetical protein
MIYNQIKYSRFILYSVVLLSIAFFMGCKTLLFTNVFGTVTKAENIEDYEGYWESDDGFIVAIKFLKDSSTMVSGILDWDTKKEKFMVKSEKRIITKLKDATFVNYKMDNNNYKVQQFELRKSDLTDKIQLLIWDPNIDEFERLVTNNNIPGQIITKTNDDGEAETDSVIVDNRSEDLLIQIMEKNNLFNYKNVQVLRRVMKPVKE